MQIKGKTFLVYNPTPTFQPFTGERELALPDCSRKGEQPPPLESLAQLGDCVQPGNYLSCLEWEAPGLVQVVIKMK